MSTTLKSILNKIMGDSDLKSSEVENLTKATEKVLVTHFVRGTYDGTDKILSDDTAITFNDPSLTQQNFKDECDINNIMKQYEKTGLISHTSGFLERFGDFSTVTDYQTALNQVMSANEAFMTLPANIRKEFNNNPEELVKFLADEKNIDRAIELGLVDKPNSTVNATIEPENTAVSAAV